MAATGAPGLRGAERMRRCVREADVAAVGCWNALLGGCDSTERRTLPLKLRALADATSAYVGPRWWVGHGAGHRRRVTEAQLRINDAVRDGDGAEFAEAFVGYDQAIATAVVSVPTELESPTP
ncbi:hypothetical protein ACL03H_12090 [Saccharopolyspora sp. MS10]|uniref:hypothetical protein n=1 Tax=Saccharopolyspora sp. MS10 TaxID=3385973 RepID=UPI0039A0719A